MQMKRGFYFRNLKGKISIKGKRLTNKESIDMYENEIIQTEVMVSKLLEMVNKPFVGVDIAQSQDQSA